METRIAYGYHTKSGKLFKLCDTIAEARKADMTVPAFEEKLVELNPQLEITFKTVERDAE